jgi:D-sedoheptulose 7-phosphate isomerase
MALVERERKRILTAIACSAATVSALAERAEVIQKIGALVVGALRRGHKVLTAGNGGSAAEALHMAEELSGRFRGNRPSLPGISLTADATALTCIGNDFGFDEIFARQIEGLGRRGDVLVVLSTSGRAANLGRAVRAARAAGMKVVCLLGRDGGVLAGRGDLELIVEGTATERIQEAHQVILHLILDAVEHAYSGAARPQTGEKRRS